VRPPLHRETVLRRAGFLRHGLAFLLRGRDPLPAKVEACLAPAGAYHVAGLGPQFWSALLQALQPSRHPGWTPEVLQGLRRTGLLRHHDGARPAVINAELCAAYARIQTLQPGLSALHVDHFLSLVAAMRGRHLFGEPNTAPFCPIAAALGRARRQ